MSKSTKLKRAAALAAVLACIEEQQPAADSRPGPAGPAPGRGFGGGYPAAGAAAPAAWALYGRQQIMNTRALMQRRKGRR